MNSYICRAVKKNGISAPGLPPITSRVQRFPLAGRCIRGVSGFSTFCALRRFPAKRVPESLVRQPCNADGPGWEHEWGAGAQGSESLPRWPPAIPGGGVFSLHLSVPFTHPLSSSVPCSTPSVLFGAMFYPEPRLRYPQLIACSNGIYILLHQ